MLYRPPPRWHRRIPPRPYLEGSASILLLLVLGALALMFADPGAALPAAIALGFFCLVLCAAFAAGGIASSGKRKRR